MKAVYLDYSATTPVKVEVFEEMKPYFCQVYGNPASIHKFGRESKKAIAKARKQVATAINARPDEIYFTAGGTESDNWALEGIMRAHQAKGKHLITLAIEHHAVLHKCEQLEKQGFTVTYLPVDKDGLVDLDNLKASITDNTVMVSIMYVNNEIGTIQDIATIGEICRENGVIFHTDAVQALGNIEIDVVNQHIDLLSLSAHKIYGAKGVGALYIKNGIKIDNLIYGGAQEKGRRSGTLNLPAIVGFGKAAEMAVANLAEYRERLISLRQRFIAKIEEELDDFKLNGHKTKRHPGNINLSFAGVEGESLLLSLDLDGIACSSGSACTSGSLDPSHVLKAIGLEQQWVEGAIRISLGDFTTEEDIDYATETLIKHVNRLREFTT